MYSADLMRSCRAMAPERGMTVGAREARRVNRVGVRPDMLKGVVDRAGSKSEPTAVWACGDVLCTLGSGLVAPPPSRYFSTSARSSLVLAVLLFVFVSLGPVLMPTTVP
jgi:hypothetical protein